MPKLIFCVIFIVIAYLSPLSAAVSIAPAPDGLDAQVTNLTAKPGRYTLLADGQPVPIYRSKNTGNLTKIEELYFASFELLEGSTSIRVETKQNITEAVIRPLSTGITPTISGKSITFTVDKPCRVSIEIDGWTHPLFLFVNPPMAAPKPADVTHYFKPGVHQIGLNFRLNENEAVYLAPGAVVEGTFNLVDSNHVSITGYGIITAGRWRKKWSQAKGLDRINTFKSTRAAEFQLDGIIAVNPVSWFTDQLWDGTRVNNIKFIGGWNYTTDGLRVSSGPFHFSNNFIATGDDGFVYSATTGLDSPITGILENSTFWIWHNSVFGAISRLVGISPKSLFAIAM